MSKRKKAIEPCSCGFPHCLKCPPKGTLPWHGQQIKKALRDLGAAIRRAFERA